MNIPRPMCASLMLVPVPQSNLAFYEAIIYKLLTKVEMLKECCINFTRKCKLLGLIPSLHPFCQVLEVVYSGLPPPEGAPVVSMRFMTFFLVKITSSLGWSFLLLLAFCDVLLLILLFSRNHCFLLILEEPKK